MASLSPTCDSGYFRGHLSAIDCFHEFLSIVIFRGLRRRHATHQMVITAWRTTAATTPRRAAQSRSGGNATSKADITDPNTAFSQGGTRANAATETPTGVSSRTSHLFQGSDADSQGSLTTITIYHGPPDVLPGGPTTVDSSPSADGFWE
jgi:hypothetical protein